MSLSSLAGDGSLTGDGSLAGDGSAETLAGGGLFGYLPGALVTTRDGIVGPWNPRQPGQELRNATPADLGERMRHWDVQVRAQVLDFELLSSFGWEAYPGSDNDRSNPPVAKLLVRSDAAAAQTLVELVPPDTAYLRESQLFHVYNHADLRRDRQAEILSQIKGVDIFLGRFSALHPERHRYTLELLAAFNRALVLAEMRIKHALAVPRPVEFSPQIMPMIQTPGHGTFPAGHAAESFMGATVLFALMEAGNGCSANAGWDEKLARLAARISVNRVIAGVHFPVDLAAGLVLGLAVGRYFVALAKGDATNLMPQTFKGPEYGSEEFPWADFPWGKILKITEPLPALNATSKRPEFTLAAPSDKKRSPLCWLWGEAVKEWQDCPSEGDTP